jgi:GNAT superfamily N-acetyltransferase
MPATQIGTELSNEGQRAAIEANLVETFHASVPLWSACETFVEPDLVQGVSGLPLSLFNPVVGARLRPAEADQRIETVIARAAAKGAPILWWVGPTSEPADLGERLLAHGFTKTSEPLGMILELAHLQPPSTTVAGLSIGEVLTPAQLQVWADVATAGFSMPPLFREGALGWFGAAGMGPGKPFRHLIAYMGTTPVATATLLAGGEVAGIYNVATLEAFRRKGIGAAITAAACELARGLGYRYAVLEASTIGAPVYRALGFVERCRFANYVWKPQERKA